MRCFAGYLWIWSVINEALSVVMIAASKMQFPLIIDKGNIILGFHATCYLPRQLMFVTSLGFHLSFCCLMNQIKMIYLNEIRSNWWGAQKKSIESDSVTKMNLSCLLSVTLFNPWYKGKHSSNCFRMLSIASQKLKREKLELMLALHLRFTIKIHLSLSMLRFEISWAI